VILTISADAEDEARRRIEWYAERNPTAAQRLADLLVATIVEIARRPEAYPLLEYRRNPGNIRRARLKKFPLLILYQVLPGEVFVFAIAHTSQRPGYWRERLRK
jgi:toxin ParE1/3/4